VDGGGQIADTGDYDDIFCPACGSVDLEDLEDMAELKAPPRWETPEQWEQRTGEAWPDDWAVYVRGQYEDTQGWTKWVIVDFTRAKTFLMKIQIVCATEAGRPPDDWMPEEE
jgi:hypothetical protein